jgi:hypothetical protein
VKSEGEPNEPEKASHSVKTSGIFPRHDSCRHLLPEYSYLTENFETNDRSLIPLCMAAVAFRKQVAYPISCITIDLFTSIAAAVGGSSGRRIITPAGIRP